MRKLDNRESRFVEEYLTHLDPCRAAIDAGYSETMAKSKAYQWVSGGKVKPHVFEAVQRRMRARESRTEITQDMVIRELAKIGFSDIRKVVTWGETQLRVVDGEDEDVMPYHGLALIDSSEIDDDIAAAIAEVSQTRDGLKVKLHDKKGALVELGKHLGIFTPKGHAELDAKLKRLAIQKTEAEISQIGRVSDTSMADVLRDLIERLPG